MTTHLSSATRPAERLAPASVTIVGAGLAGHATAKALRAQGFDGRLTLVGAETHRPYDRPPLSKEFLLGTLSGNDLTLERAGEDLQADWLLGHQATGLAMTGTSDHPQHTITLADGSALVSDAVVVATGSKVRRFPSMLAGVHTVRTLEDARALKEELVPGARLVVIGAGFIGAEIAAVGHALGLDVTVLEAAPTPLAVPLGEQAGAAVASLHGRHGVTLRCQAMVSSLLGESRVTGVQLTDGEVLEADVVVVGIGAVADTDWLAGSGAEITSGGVLCDHTGVSTLPELYALGDCAAWFDPVLGWHRRIEHWTDSKDRGPIVAARLLGAPLPSTIRAPYFWSDQYGVKIQFAGRRSGDEDLVIEAGSVESGELLATYRRSDEPVAVLAIGRQPEFMRIRKRLSISMPGGPADVARTDVSGPQARIA